MNKMQSSKKSTIIISNQLWCTLASFSTVISYFCNHSYPWQFCKMTGVLLRTNFSINSDSVKLQFCLKIGLEISTFLGPKSSIVSWKIAKKNPWKMSQFLDSHWDGNKSQCLWEIEEFWLCKNVWCWPKKSNWILRLVSQNANLCIFWVCHFLRDLIQDSFLYLCKILQPEK